MNNLSKREKLLILILIIGILGYGYMQFFLKPLMSDISDTQNRINLDKNQITTIESIKANRAELIKQRDNAVGETVILMKRLPLTLRDPQIVFDLNMSADLIGVKLDTLGMNKPIEWTGQSPMSDGSSNLPPPVKSDINVASIDLKVEADSYLKITDFIDAIEKADRITNVSSTSIESSLENKGSIICIVKVDYFCFNTETRDAILYSFNKGVYGKPNPFND